MADEQREQPTSGEGALDPDEKFGQGTDASHPESAAGDPVERTDPETAAAEPEGSPEQLRGR